MALLDEGYVRSSGAGINLAGIVVLYIIKPSL
jgi:hypothetical protein